MDEEGAPEVTDLVPVPKCQALPGTHPVVEGQRDEPLPAGSGKARKKLGPGLMSSPSA